MTELIWAGMIGGSCAFGCVLGIWYSGRYTVSISDGAVYQLLKKYIRWVGECEGIDFIQRHRRDGSIDCELPDDKFSEREKRALLRLSNEVWWEE